MAQSQAKILIHLVYSTKHRAKVLPHEPYEALHKYCGGILKNHKCHLVEMNNVEDHVHLLFDLHRTEALSDIVKELKEGSSKWLKDQSPDYRGFEWQDGFGAFSLGMSRTLSIACWRSPAVVRGSAGSEGRCPVRRGLRRCSRRPNGSRQQINAR